MVHCIESDTRKCAFLREAARATGAAAQIHPVRVEAIDPDSLGPVDAVTARAFAPLPLTLKLARPWMERGAVAVFPRGESARDQIAALPEARLYAIETMSSVVNPKAAILRIRQG
jgi:16S rRNA (guanine527-N7)-methyltransferase